MGKVRPSPSNKTRVSPYPLRSTRTQREPMEAQSPSQWEDVRCVICQEAPHNAVLLRCASSSNGCRAYMCDTSARHSNCFKQYRKKNMNKISKILNCPYCRGEVYETMTVVSGGRRAMNAKPRCCAFESCNFSGTYSQLKNHLKADHPRPLVVDQGRERALEQFQRVTEHNDIMAAADHPRSTRPLVIDQGRERVWEQLERVSEDDDIMAEADDLEDSFEFYYQRLPNIPPRLVVRYYVNGVLENIWYHEVPNGLPHSFVIRAEVDGVRQNYRVHII